MLLDALDDPAQFKLDLGHAVKTLAQAQYHDEFKPHGRSGNDFSHPINDELQIVFKRETERNAQGTPLLVHFYLKTIERIK